LKALIKYPLSLFILLLVSYSQLFAPLYRGNTPAVPSKKVLGTEQGQAIDVKSPDSQAVFIAEEEEEEDDRMLSRKNLGESSVFFYVYEPDFFIQLIESYAPISRDISSRTFFKAPYLVFQVFRL
jgi:hypothetical protein